MVFWAQWQPGNLPLVVVILSALENDGLVIWGNN